MNPKKMAGKRLRLLLMSVTHVSDISDDDIEDVKEDATGAPTEDYRSYCENCCCCLLFVNFSY